ncbi:50S ribosomal protein L7/L12 [Treponema parvum]|uniref:Large ribosomal subunit protein bL12 n=1 Tax=Treponema parvum TaxID=138851 RepID=A0A975F1A1_9SPIR|nr:50S ribosomal protein L7/L12 [Treponema parvum]QTQ12532.1 50S ribosomal protein L7/L12 [Treponema parvum]QTQ13240.1 50S ribosomal protein L7/L12 [Treponema parvum]QTQ15474.1 50S ribosomal protein L7/L12 [Treponema parvum]
MAALTNDQILDAIANMTVLEASELVKAMEEKFGVTAAVAVAAAPAGGAAAAGGGEEQTEFTVTLDSFDAAKKIPVIKIVREITGLGLGEAKALVEGAPKTVKEGVSKADADEMIKKITEAGGKASKK